MSLKERMESLRARHTAVENLLQDEVHRPLPSSGEISRLKREKLRLKDEMARLSIGATVH